MALGGCCFINIFNNQMEVGIRGRRCIEEDTRPRRNVRGGCYLFVWSSESINNKKRKKHDVALDGCRSKYFHTTTNQKYAAVINNGMKEGCKWRAAGRKCDSLTSTKNGSIKFKF